MFINKKVIDNLNMNLFSTSESPNPVEIYPDTKKFEMPQLTSSIIRQNSSLKENQTKENEQIKRESEKIIEETKPKTKKYVITDRGEDNIKIPENYSTDDIDEFTLINLLNEPKENYELAVDNKLIKTYKRQHPTHNTFVLKSYTTIPYPIEKVKEVLCDLDNMDKWEKTYKKHEIIEELPVDPETNLIKRINYLYIKLPAFMTDRDIVEACKIWKNFNNNPDTFLMFSKSGEHEKYPPTKKPIRAELLDGGFYLEKISENETKLIMVNGADLFVTTGGDFVKKLMVSSPEDYTKNLIKYLKSICK